MESPFNAVEVLKRLRNTQSGGGVRSNETLFNETKVYLLNATITFFFLFTFQSQVTEETITPVVTAPVATVKIEEKSKLSKFKSTNNLINSSPTAMNNLFNSLLLASANSSSTYTDNSNAFEPVNNTTSQNNVNSNNHMTKNATAVSPSKDIKLLENENKELKLKNNESITKIARLENICNDLKTKHDEVGKYSLLNSSSLTFLLTFLLTYVFTSIVLSNTDLRGKIALLTVQLSHYTSATAVKQMNQSISSAYSLPYPSATSVSNTINKSKSTSNNNSTLDRPTISEIQRRITTPPSDYNLSLRRNIHSPHLFTQADPSSKNTKKISGFHISTGANNKNKKTVFSAMNHQYQEEKQQYNQESEPYTPNQLTHSNIIKNQNFNNLKNDINNIEPIIPRHNSFDNRRSSMESWNDDGDTIPVIEVDLRFGDPM